MSVFNWSAVSSRRPSRRWIPLCCGALLLLVGCSVKVDIGEAAAERVYLDQVSAGLNDVKAAASNLHPACDKGGDRGQCLSAGQKFVGVVDNSLGTLQKASVPSSLSEAHAALVAALKDERDAMATRNQGLTSGDEALWTKGNEELGRADEHLQEAVRRFPSSSPSS